MPNKFWPATAIEGEDSLESIDGSELKDGDAAFVVTEHLVSFYRLNADSGAEHDPPEVVAPSVNAGTKRWLRLGVVGEEPVAFDAPTDIDGCLLWLDMSDTETMDLGASDTILSVSNKAALELPQMPYNHPDQKPVYIADAINGLGAAKWTDTGRQSIIYSDEWNGFPLPESASGYTGFMVIHAEVSGHSGNQILLEVSNPDPWDTIAKLMFWDGEWGGEVGPSGAWVETAFHFEETKLLGFDVESEGGFSVLTDGEEVESGTESASFSNSDLVIHIGGNDIYGFANASVPRETFFCEILLYTRKLSTEERQVIEGYLAHKWGIDGKLPANHPFKNNAPGT